MNNSTETAARNGHKAASHKAASHKAMPKAKSSAARPAYGIAAHYDSEHGLPSFEVHMTTDGPIHQWLAAKRQQTEQLAARLRREVGNHAPNAARLIEQAETLWRETGPDAEEEEWVMVPKAVYFFAAAALELHRRENELRTLGIMPERAGITREQSDWFLAEVADEDDEDDEEDSEASQAQADGKEDGS